MSFEITEGIETGPWKMILYGAPGIGKTTLASLAPNALIVDVEDGSAKLACRRIRVKKFHELRESVTFAARQPDVQTVVYDSASAIENLITKHLCQTYNWKDLSTPGYGKGNTALHQEWLKFLECLTYLKDRGKNIILIAHARTKTFENPQGENFDLYEPDLLKASSTKITSLFDTVLFYHSKVILKSHDKGDKSAMQGGNQILTVDKVSAVAKNRFMMPEYISIPNLMQQPEAFERQVASFWNLLY